MHKLDSCKNDSTVEQSPMTRLGDVAAMIRVMRPVNGKVEAVDVRRRMLADLCKFIGVQLGTVPPGSLGFSVIEMKPSAVAVEPGPPPLDDLPPRLQQTMRHLLDGDSEKQVAMKLKLSPHTVHAYIKSLYRRFNVCSRAELMSQHVKRLP